MARRIDWERNYLARRSINDERELMQLAANWLKRPEQRRAQKQEKQEQIAACLRELRLTAKQIGRHLNGGHSPYQFTPDQIARRERKRRNKLLRAQRKQRRIPQRFKQLDPGNPHDQLLGVDLERPPW